MLNTFFLIEDSETETFGKIEYDFILGRHFLTEDRKHFIFGEI